MALFDRSTPELSLLGLPDQVDGSRESADAPGLFDLLKPPELLVELRARAEKGMWGPWREPRQEPRRRGPWLVDPFRKESTR